MTANRARRWVTALVVAATALAAGCGGSPSRPAAQATPLASPPPTLARVSPTLSDGTPYAAAVDAAVSRHLEVWVETDLVKHWLAGSASFYDAVRKAASLAMRPGVTGLKVADELGYHDGLQTPAQVQAFLDDTARALHAAAPHRQILVDMVLPELGCDPGAPPSIPGAVSCAARERGKFPALALPAVDGYLASGDVDVLDLSTGLQDDSIYSYWGITKQQAQAAAWQEVRRRGWQQHVQLRARKALAHPGAYTGGPQQAQADVSLYVDLPLRQGAAAVDVWTWRQVYQGQLVRLMDPGLASNPLWAALAERHRAGYRLLTHFSPSSVEVGLDADLDALATVFTGVFIAAGTG